MPNNLKVSLDETTNPWVVKIDEKGNANEVARNPEQQTITWQLDGNAATGDIIDFNWVGTQPKADIFGQPKYNNNDHNMTLTDLNNSAATTGDWIYKLTIEVDNNQYSTNASITGTTDNPTIKNN
ncbi:hypothetical protein [Dyella japonica]|uniref:Uncharacterized protein n=1 Tax=Dyella japonica A8 TaxID=1217721 RepID=A0A075JVL4_9GAMM|nr:hypothetical protein [Dyella japonica]AIF45969.1 hypothetical protein HY57_01145 [Dyella japonica A8]